MGCVKLPGCRLYSLKPLKDCDDGHVDVVLLTSVPKRKQKHDKDPMRHLLMFKPRTNQKDVHNPALSKEVGTKNKTKSEKNKKQKQSID